MPDAQLPDDTVITEAFWDPHVREQVITICTSATRPSAVEGRTIYETDTNRYMGYNGSAWVRIHSIGGELPTRLLFGVFTDTTETNGVLPSMTFTTPFGSTPTVVATVATTSTTQQDTAQINAVNASAVQFRIMRNGNNVGSGVSVTVHWMAGA